VVHRSLALRREVPSSLRSSLRERKSC
jgi:hypothetical protein